MQPFAPEAVLVSPSVQENDAFWSFVNFDDEAVTKDLWMPTEMWCNSATQDLSSVTASVDCSPTSDTGCDGRSSGAPSREPEIAADDATVEDGQVARNKRAKRQAQNRIAQQAFRARKEKLVRGLSVDLANLQSQYATTKAENERLSNDLRLAQTELSAIHSVLHRPGAAAASPGGADAAFTTRLEPRPGDDGPCTLTLHINLDSVMAERSRRQAALATPPASETGEGGMDVDLGALCERMGFS